jgi:hypothetical protein
VSDDVHGTIGALSSLLDLDPGNLALSAQLWFALVDARKPVEAVRVLDDARSRVKGAAGLTDVLRANTIFSFTGDLGPLAPFSKRENVFARGDAQFDADDALRITFERLVLRGEYAEARGLIDEFGRDSIRVSLINYFHIGGVGRQPTADFRGWADLLLGDRDAAREDGRKLLAIVDGTAVTRWNAWFLAALRADAQLFMGRPDEAADTARTMLDLTKNTWIGAVLVGELHAGRVLAWAGKEDPAVDVLTRLATDVPGLPPAEIARQPYYTTPLRGNARFDTLVQRLEAEMAATDLR